MIGSIFGVICCNLTFQAVRSLNYDAGTYLQIRRNMCNIFVGRENINCRCNPYIHILQKNVE